MLVICEFVGAGNNVVSPYHHLSLTTDVHRIIYPQTTCFCNSVRTVVGEEMTESY